MLGFALAAANVRPVSSDELPLRITAKSALAHPDTYDGKTVTIEGTFAIGPEMQEVFDSDAGYSARDSRECLSVALTTRLGRHVYTWSGKTVSIVGKFRSHICPQNHICLGYCSEAGIEGISVERN
jgi:hypothetical protein